MKDLLLGLDTELVVTTRHGVLYPHVAKVEQERGRTDLPFDWHGDGYAWELCVAPAKNPSGILVNVANGLFDLHSKWAPTRMVGPSMYMVPQRVVRQAPAIVKRLGCMPSLNLYAKPGKPGGLPQTMRTTGCHIHTSSPELNKKNYRDVLLWNDVLIGGVWTYVSPEPSFDERLRRKYYGKAGEYRVRFYNEAMTLFGVEYRTLPGNALHHPDYLNLMLHLAMESADRARVGAPPKTMVDRAVNVITKATRDNILLPMLDLSSELREEIEAVRKLKATTVNLAAWKQYRTE